MPFLHPPVTSSSLLLATLLLLPQKPAAPKAGPLAQNAYCRPAELRDFCRVGCHDANPKLTRQVALKTDKLRKPEPRGIAILELGITRAGDVVSACVLRGVRDDFDKAAQVAARQWKFRPQAGRGAERGYMLTVTVCTPNLKCRPATMPGGRGN